MKKRILFTAASLLLAIVVFGQRMGSNFQYGKVIFQIKEDKMVFIPADANGIVDVRNVSFLSGLSEKYQITKVIQKFPACENAALRKTYEVQFKNNAAADELVRDLNQVDVLKYAEKKLMHYNQFAPNDTYYQSNSLWHLAQINAPAAWDISKGSASIVVAVIDGAFSTSNPDLTGKLSSKSFDVADNDANVNPPANNGLWDHGSHTAGIAGGATDNGKGISSIGFNVTVLAIKATNDTAKNPDAIAWSLEGIIYAVDHGARVISCSFGANANASQIAFEQTAIDYAYSKGCVVVAASGNAGNSTKIYPAACKHVISVSATDQNDALASFSNYGTWVTLCAPGVSIWSTITNHAGTSSGVTYYDILDGTSMACPMVAGLAGLMLSVNPNLDPDEVTNCLKSGCDNIDASNPGKIGSIGSGRINAQKAMQCASTTIKKPVVDFVANKIKVNTGANVIFTDLSTNEYTTGAAITYSWSFTGGTPTTSTAKNPTIKYNTLGCYAVTLTVTNPAGSGSLTKTCMINVVSTPISQLCDTIAHIDYTDTITEYSLTNKEGYLSGTNSHNVRAVVELFDAPPSGKAVSGVGFFFSQAYAGNANNTADVHIWSNVGGKPGAVLSTQTVKVNSLITTDVTIINLPAPVYLTGSFFAGIQFVGRGPQLDTIAVVSNTFYRAKSNGPNRGFQLVDATWYSDSALFGGSKLEHLIFTINCPQLNTGVNEITQTTEMEIFPNPTTGNVNVMVPNGSITELNISVYDMLGALVAVADKSQIQNGMIKLNLSENKSGIYFVECRSNLGISAKKIVLTQ